MQSKIYAILQWLLCSVIFICFISCNNESLEQPPSEIIQVKTVAGNCLTLYSDFEHDYENMSGYAVITRGDSVFISNKSKDHIFTFDAYTGNLVSKQQIFREGPLSVGSGSRFDNALFISRDSFFYSSNSENKIYVATADSTKVVVDYSNGDKYQLINSYRCVPVVGDEHIVFPISRGATGKNPQRYSFVAVEQNFTSYQEVISALPVYEDKYFTDIPYLYWPSMVYNPNSGNYAVSFPIDHRIFEYDKDFKLVREHDLFHETVGEIEPYSAGLNGNDTPDRQKETAYYRALSHFVGFFHLSESDQYVRLARITDPVDGKWLFRGFVYNNDFVPIEEFAISEDYSIFNAFSFGNGMYFLNTGRLESEITQEVPFDCLVFDLVQTDG